MRLFSVLLIILMILGGCTAKSEKTEETVLLRNFAPSGEPVPTELPEKTEKRGIIKSIPSSDKKKVAYIFTFDATAESVEYALSVQNKSETFTYDESKVLFRSNWLFNIEWGDDTTLMASLDEKETQIPAPLESDGVMVMFGQVLSD